MHLRINFLLLTLAFFGLSNNSFGQLNNKVKIRGNTYYYSLSDDSSKVFFAEQYDKHNLKWEYDKHSSHMVKCYDLEHGGCNEFFPRKEFSVTKTDKKFELFVGMKDARWAIKVAKKILDGEEKKKKWRESLIIE